SARCSSTGSSATVTPWRGSTRPTTSWTNRSSVSRSRCAGPTGRGPPSGRTCVFMRRFRGMETRTIGALSVSLVGLGCNNFGMRIDADQTKAVVSAALDSGITFFDSADIYGRGLSEEFLGKALKGHRDEVVVATKFGMPMDDDP